MTTTQGASASADDKSLPQRFFRYFQHEITALQDQMARLADTALIAGERADAADHCLAGISRLSSEVKDASTYLPPYDQRTYAEAIKALQEKLAETKAAFAPKSKFTFKSARKSPSAISLSDAAELAAQKRRHVPGYLSPNSSTSATPNYLRTPDHERASDDHLPVPSAPPPTAVSDHHNTFSSISTPSEPSASTDPIRPQLSTTATSISISNQSNAHIILPSSAFHSQTPCSLSRLTSCCMDLSTPTTTTAPFASLTINTATSSLLLCGSISGPAHLTNIRRSVLVISCRQFRMHECENVDVYLHTTSRPIIEDCRGIRFAELPKSYVNLLPAETPKSTKMWSQIDDFNWLKSEPSPNWSMIPPSDIIMEEIWSEIVPGGPGWSLDDILRAVGIVGK